jgi:hypothetical protein
MSHTYQFAVTAPTARQTNVLAEDLSRMLGELPDFIEVRRVKTDQESLDIGNIIVAIVGSQFAVEGVRTLGAWLTKHPEGSLDVAIEEESGKRSVRLSASGLTPEQLERQIKSALNKK